MKTCTRCREEKLIAEFHRSAGKPDGRRAWCKSCANRDTPDQRAARKKERDRVLAARDAQVAAMTAAGLSGQAIAEALGITFTQARAARERAGVASAWTPPKQEHGLAGYQKHGCRCEVCSTANREAGKKSRATLKARPAEAVPHGLNGYLVYACRCDVCSLAGAEKNREARAGRYARTVGTATRHGYEWTGPELELIARGDLTAEEIARLIGRTSFAVQTQRYMMRRDPRRARLADLATPVADLADPTRTGPTRLILHPIDGSRS